MHDMNLQSWFRLITSIAATTLASHAAEGQVWEPLFNGTDLTGWHTQPGGQWLVRDGVIVGQSAHSELRHGLLVTDRSFGNFILRAKFLVHQGNSGLYFRVVETAANAAVRGFQAEVDRT